MKERIAEYSIKKSGNAVHIMTEDGEVFAAAIDEAGQGRNFFLVSCRRLENGRVRYQHGLCPIAERRLRINTYAQSRQLAMDLHKALRGQEIIK